MSFEPAWASSSSTPASTTPTNNNSSNQLPSSTTTTSASSAIKPLPVQRIFSVINIILASLMGVTGIFSLLKIKSISPSIFVSAYTFLFALLLFTYEITWWVPIPFVKQNLKKNFGFLFGHKGKSFFILFVAFLNFGITGSSDNVDDLVNNLAQATGIAMLVNGIAHFGIMAMYPELMFEAK